MIDRRARRRARLVAGGLVPTGLLLLGLTGVARAQGAVDVDKPAPNVMILLDTSGSMEKMPNGSDPVCTAGATSDKNRWGAAVESLTGTISNSSGQEQYSCVEISRSISNASFTSEYGLPGVASSKIYDINYSLPYHRPVSLDGTKQCVYAPGYVPGSSDATRGLGGSPSDYPAYNSASGSKNAIYFRDYTQAIPANYQSNCTFYQYDNGILDSARDIIRFGLMTFDSDTNKGTGVTGIPPSALAANPFQGTWSYFPGWDGSTTAVPAQGRPYGCAFSSDLEVGARNSAAPPWEGRLIGLPSNPDATVADMEAQNKLIQFSINATRPWGATPIEGMFSDAKYYFWNDASGPNGTSKDAYVVGGCRKQYIILITDGQPNLDLRPSCLNPDGTETNCPYSPDVYTTAGDLYAGKAGPAVTTYVVGFAVSDDTGTPVSCTDIVSGTAPNQTVDTSKCTTGSKYAPCCVLEKIALNGSGGKQSAFFASTPADLSKQLNAVIADITAKTTTRTVPTYSPTVADVPDQIGTSGFNSAIFLASLYPTPSQPWTGDIKRQRYVCDSSFQLTQPTPDATLGDDFASNVNSHTGRTRNFLVVEPNHTTYDAAGTIRPSTAIDGLEAATAEPKPYPAESTTRGTATTAMNAISAASLGVGSPTNSSPSQCANLTQTAHLSATDCKELALRFVMGTQSGPGGLNSTYAPFQSRYDAALGDILHATPTVVGPPSAYIRDDSYQGFKAKWAATTTPPLRPTVLYAATNDGLLHAFDISVSKQENNEIWAFLPPAVMPKLLGTYPATHTLLLDAAPVVKDVVFSRTSGDLGNIDKWHTALVAGIGATASGESGYYALDVTDPDPDNSKGTGPSFLWQLTKMPPETDGSIRKLFGPSPGIPAIATVFIDVDDGSGVPSKHEIGVAILPGGSGSKATSTKCTRDATYTNKVTNLAMSDDSTYALRDGVRCWPKEGRSLSVVRLDTGEILRTFVQDIDTDVPTVLKSRATAAPIYAPITSAPVVYPTTVGATAQRVFMGDADGNVLRLDLSSSDTSKWKVDIFFDAYNAAVDNTSTAWSDGQPVVVQPVVALDRNGRVVVEMATGDQDIYTSSGTNYVWSVTEALSSENPPNLRARPNWYLQFLNGKRVTGPMAVFDEVFYFTTFTPDDTTTNKCGGGTPEIYGRDFVQADSQGISFGGIPRFNPDQLGSAPVSYTPPNSTGLLIPGVSINIPPTCANTGNGMTDSYVPGATHYQATNIASSTPRLTVQFAGVKGTTTSGTTEFSIGAPSVSTVIDSWAAIVE